VKDPIEEALEKLKPDEMPPELMARLTAARSQFAGSPSKEGGFWQRWVLPLAAGGCAALVAFFWLKQNPSATPRISTASTAAPMPFERQDILLGTREVGMLVAPDQRPYRVMEIEWLEQDTVRPNGRGPAVLVETTRREVVPVAMEIF
jgi:hypothetical protein